MKSQTTVLQVGGLNWATSAAIVEQTLRRRPGVLAVEANAVSQTANVTYDPDRTDIAELLVDMCEIRAAPVRFGAALSRLGLG